MKWLLTLSLLVALLSATNSCKKEGPGEPAPTDSIGRINRWILDSMRRYYYWADQMPRNYDYSRPTGVYFKGLLSPQDRFSWISNGEDIKPPSNVYFTHGFHYVLLQVPDYPHYIGVVTLVNRGGPAFQEGLKRGSYFIKVNGADITTANVEAVKEQLKQPLQVRLVPAEYENHTWKPLPEVAVRAGYQVENPIHCTRSFTAAGITTGYLYYQSFDEQYDGQLLQAIAKLKKANIQELILDLRYNAGGSVASSAKLSALIAQKLTGGETFVIYAGNRQEGRKPRSLQRILHTSASNAGKQYADLQSNGLFLQRVFILTTGATVSAAELLVNNLKPFINVVQIGETTAGKDEASFLIEDHRTPPLVKWKLQPTVYKLFNKNNQGGYHNGLAPSHAVAETASLPLYDIGEPGDALLYKALQLIYGTNIPSSYINLRKRTVAIQPVSVSYHSAMEQAGPSVLMLAH